MENETKTIELGKLFSKKELKDIKKLIDSNKWKELREYLNTEPLKVNLFSKGVLADYIYYWFESMFKKSEVKK